MREAQESIFINGEWRSAISSLTFQVTDPASGAVIGEVANGSTEDGRAAIAAAEAAFPQWSAETAYARSEILHAAHSRIVARSEDLARLMTCEQGKPLRAARNEVKYAADFLIWFAEEAKRLYGQTIPSSRANQRFMVLHEPIGVVAAITPWNYPISMITRKVGPALAAGCTVVLKPAEQTPLCAIEVFRILEESGVPAGVMNLVTALDPRPIGAELVSNPAVGKVTFTGSTSVGMQLAEGAAKRMKRFSMELGGHAPFIVFDDADPAYAATGAAMSRVLNAGQACICANRIYVQRSIKDAFVDALIARLSKLKSGDGLTDGVSIGPLIDGAAMERMERQVSDAVSKGANVETGGFRLTGEGLDDGYFFAPTVLTGVTEKMSIYREETFGPIAPVIVFDDETEVIGMANDSDYGLASYVYTQNLSRAMRVAEALHFGIVGVNDIDPTSAAAPFGGVKHSGQGREGAHEGLLEYVNTKLVGFRI